MGCADDWINRPIISVAKSSAAAAEVYATQLWDWIEQAEETGTPDLGNRPKMVKMIAKWTEADEMITRLLAMSAEERAVELAKRPKINFSDVLNTVADVSGYMEGLEIRAGALYQAELNAQLQLAVTRWKSMLERAKAGVVEY